MHPAIRSKGIACALLACLVFGSLPAFAQGPTGVPAPAAGPTPVAPVAPVAPPPAPPPADVPVPAPPPAAETMPAAPPADMPPPSAPPPPPMEATPGPTEPPPPAQPMPASEGPKPKLPAYVLWGVGAAGMAAGTVLGIEALVKKSDFDDAPTYGKADRVHDFTVAADVCLGAGLIALVSGTIFYFVNDTDAGDAQAKRAPSPLAKIKVEPMLGRQTNGGSVTLSF